MTSLSTYKVILWDFDGVIMDSMSVRDKGFEKVLSSYPKSEVDRLMVFHRKNGGLSRYVKFRYFFEEIRKENISDEMIQNLASSFSEIMRKQLVNPSLLIEESNSFIRKNHMRYKMHVVSGSDELELKYICSQLGLSRYFNSVQGSPTSKSDLVKELLFKEGYPLNEVVLIGDSINDYEAAHLNGIDFFGYNSTDLRKVGTGYIDAFISICSSK